MEMKWIGIVIAVWVTVMFGSLAYMTYANSQCKIAAIEKGMPAADIAILCKQ